MKIERIIAFANAKVRLEFLAMERSLRATGCDLPLLVIPFDDNLFELPQNAEWSRHDELFGFLKEKSAVPQCRKLTAFLNNNCAFFDSDIIHLKNPVEWLKPLPENAFVVADTEWEKAQWTFTKETRDEYQSNSTIWLLDNFNSGFFAFSSVSVTLDMIKTQLSDPKHWKLLVGRAPTTGEQAAANYLISLSGIEVVNLCLPPHRMESTMACDYPPDCDPLLKKPNAPAFVHYAGPGRNYDAPIARLIFDYLTKAEAAELWKEFELRKERARRHGHWPIWVRIAKRIVSRIDSRFCIQWNDSKGAV